MLRSRPLRLCEVPLHAVETRKQQLDAYFRRASDSAISDEIRSDLAKHGIVLVCGFVERSVETVIMEKIARRAHPRVQSFVRGYFKIGTNYNCEAIAQAGPLRIGQGGSGRHGSGDNLTLRPAWTLPVVCASRVCRRSAISEMQPKYITSTATKSILMTTERRKPIRRGNHTTTNCVKQCGTW
jgi:hypothetical protein